ncbi:aminomethyltransferase family protein [Parvibaculum sp.]|uniref:aminomethyltransferase family protein n=1 Tax=Parvibaculum sp. TaxID=2024848 RepID=UPI00391DB3BD
MTPDTLPKPNEEQAEMPREVADPADERAPVDPALFEEVPEEPPYMRAVATTPLHLETAAESRTNRWTGWNGYTVPEVLSDLADEYRALRGAAVLMDLSPLVKYRIAGRDALACLERLLAVRVAPLAIDRSRHVIFCDGGGFVLGDGLLFRLAEDEYRLVAEEAHFAWLTDSAEGFRVRIEDVSATLAVLALQGPYSCFMFSGLGIEDMAALAPGAARWIAIGGMPVYASRTGATGDLGYELWCDAEDAPHVWREVMTKAAPFGLKPAGFALRELARLEAGHPRAGHDYLSAFAAIDPRDALQPASVWPGFVLDPSKGLFNGGAALRAAGGIVPARRVVRLAVEGLEPVRFAAISLGGRVVGTATSTGFSPALGANIALATIETAVAGAGGLSVAAERKEGISVSEFRLPARLLREPAFSHPRRFTVPAPSRG